MKTDVNKLFEELARLSQVEAIALGGSRATGRNDEKSDYDVYVYLNSAIDEAIRRSILEKYCSYMEIGNSFWELEDDVTLKDGIDMDIIYRDMNSFENAIYSVVIDCTAYNSYTTCMWHNLITSKIMVDKNGKLCELQQKYKIPYPQKLKENIISNNLKLLSGMLPSFDAQIKKAEERKDHVSVNHRLTEFLASYFDIIFALNEMTHPGEKRMQTICANECQILPNNFNENLEKLFKNIFRESISPIINDMVFEIKKISKGEI
jgi:predicted nucleotidyltransferase